MVSIDKHYILIFRTVHDETIRAQEFASIQDYYDPPSYEDVLRTTIRSNNT